eukprot:TRINITY_DN7999_c0_g1_i1.p1 TRINITY_DN7999_c0_g1~~TRINITY_DN7999_c0_g1_i1.p1  ORF type:complete len:122 (+),score=5.06 TRINITY_DN7999_c0_g1_i1:173-538(+)
MLCTPGSTPIVIRPDPKFCALRSTSLYVIHWKGCAWDVLQPRHSPPLDCAAPCRNASNTVRHSLLTCLVKLKYWESVFHFEHLIVSDPHRDRDHSGSCKRMFLVVSESCLGCDIPSLASMH